ncbi:hypothetical protein GCM10023201_41140 [Actinomycetospora corticicola]|uniref:Uncharacterized protein n=1 Tax=Actinomycetospora corticicola TaxID=663602 RepID=A0A7Y9DWJ5_9PSEU|nr:phage holin family protein [Actinomycetospora corticicola]NYD36799.1 hypothetical protein [Actinomycetospora corticicola]
MTQHRRPTLARQGVAGTAAALVLGYLAGTVLLMQLVYRLAPVLGPVGAYSVLVAVVLVGTAGYVLIGRRYEHLDAAEPDPERCDRDHVAHAEEQVDAQIAMLVRSGVDQDKAQELVRDSLVWALTPRGGPSIADILGGRSGQRDGEQRERTGSLPVAGRPYL